MVLAAVSLLVALAAPASRAEAAGGPVTIANYTDPSQAMAWGNRSHWKQPWRSYMDTVPATTLLDAIGINLNVKSAWAASTAKLLADSGFKRARIEVGWGSIDYADPGRLEPGARANLVTYLDAMKENGIRPLILLNANSGGPCPTLPGTVTLTRAAPAGTTVLHIRPSDVPAVVPGRTGIRSGSTAAQYLFKSVSANGTVQLSAPLGEALPSKGNEVSSLPAGPLAVETLLYEPFRPATLEDGAPNPAFQKTLRGWLRYVGVVTREVKAILGSESFDVEIWNELSFGSRFLNINGYYQPALEWKDTGDVDEILDRTVAYLREPKNGVPGIGIGDGFANTVPWPSGSTSPIGLTAIDKHPYAGLHAFPAEAQVNGIRPLNGLGEPAGIEDLLGQWHEAFTPTYDAFFPEYYLSGIQTETLVHDLSPEPSMVGGVEYGRYTHPEGGAPPTMWITEANLNPASGPTPVTEMTPADIQHIEAKDTLRYLTAYVNKGVTALDFYAADAGNLSLIDPGFFEALQTEPSAYPGDAAGGEVMAAVRRLAAAMQGAEPIASPRSLSLRELTQYSDDVQFEGNGTPEYPPLYNREVLAFLPFQVTPRRFVVPVYVMTRNVAEVYDRSAPETDPGRFDLPAEPYEMAIGGVDGSDATVSATDPLTGQAVPVQVVSRSDEELVVEMPVTDSPRLLTIEEAPPPVCQAVSTSTAASTAVQVGLDCSGSEGFPDTYSVLSGPEHGSISDLDAAAGTATYTPQEGYAGPDSFTYEATNAGGASNAATAAIAVGPAPPAAAATPEAAQPVGAPQPTAPQPAPGQLGLGQLERNPRAGTATLGVEVPVGGLLQLAGRGVKTATATVSGAGTVSLTVEPTGRARRRLARAGHVSVRVSVTFTPVGGGTITEHRRVRLVRHHRRRP